MPDNNGIPFENIDPRTIIGASANQTKVLRGDGQWVDAGEGNTSLSGDQADALNNANNPKSNNPYATIADIPTDKDVKAIRVVSGTRERKFYSGVGAGATSSQDGLKKALAEATSGDTVQQVTKAAISGISGYDEQIRLQNGVNYDTSGFDIDARNGGDGLIMVGGTGIIQGRNATIYHEVYGTWGMGYYGYNGNALDYHIYDMHIHTTHDNNQYYASPFSVYLQDCKIYHTGNIYSSSIACIRVFNNIGWTTNLYEHVGTVTGDENCVIFNIFTSGHVIQRGDVIITGSAVAGNVTSNSTFEMIGGILNFTTTSTDAGFKISPDSTIILNNVTVLGQVPVLPYTTGQAFGATVILRGSTTLQNSIFDSSLHIVDERPPKGMIVRTVNGSADNGGKFTNPTYFNDVPLGFYVSSTQQGDSFLSDGINPIYTYLYDGSTNVSLFNESRMLICTIFANSGDTWVYRENVTNGLDLVNGLINTSKVNIDIDLSFNSPNYAASSYGVNEAIQRLRNDYNTSAFSYIAENEYGEHPAFGNQSQFNIWVLQRLTGQSTQPESIEILSVTGDPSNDL